MGAKAVFAAHLSLVLVAGVAYGSDASQFCSTLKNAGLVQPWSSQSLYYRDSSGQPTLLNAYDSMSKSRAEVLYYYLRSTDAEYNQASVINLKFVYKSDRTATRRDYVDLNNDRWTGLSERRRQKIANDCARVNVEGYDRFHLEKTRDYCLQFHFHQNNQAFNTLGTVQRRESFAFGAMVGGPPPGIGAVLISLLGPGPAAAANDQNQLATAPYSQVRSSIQNFRHGMQPDLCIAITPNYPDSATYVDLRINYLGTAATDFVSSRDWHLKLSR